MRPIRLGEPALEDIEAQVPPGRIDAFRRHDLAPVLDALAGDDAIWEEVGVPHGPGRRFALAGQTVLLTDPAASFSNVSRLRRAPPHSRRAMADCVVPRRLQAPPASARPRFEADTQAHVTR